MPVVLLDPIKCAFCDFLLSDLAVIVLIAVLMGCVPAKNRVISAFKPHMSHSSLIYPAVYELMRTLFSSPLRRHVQVRAAVEQLIDVKALEIW